MSHPQYQVLAAAENWLNAGERVWLCTILDTWGSSPRPAGSMLAVSESGRWAGSVSGGCLEEDLLQRTAREDRPDCPQITDYGVTTDDRERFRLPCGGRIRLLIEPLAGEKQHEAVCRLLGYLDAKVPASRIVDLKTGQMIIEASDGQGTGITEQRESVRHTLGPECRLLLVGAGEVAGHVAAFGRRCGFDVTLCEPRETFLAGWTDSETPVLTSLPDDLVLRSFNDSHTAILALAHDPRVDDMALLAALQSSCFYVGAMGSKQTSQMRRERLVALGITEQQLERLHAPIGIAIRSKTPAEIAISVIADLVDARHRLLADSGAL
ncbi:XdhC family protein [Marinobacter fonticola]|uniref:XdhC family protein n=1 Tax=Marinobacter fonticola TaxID=2603215 RepID=UPI0011E86A20|nr:XdhC family protein [Marinobacter fonticola]